MGIYLKDGNSEPKKKEIANVKVKCIACASRIESRVVKGVVSKKNVTHRRMTSKVDKPRMLILGGALDSAAQGSLGNWMVDLTD
ncbi:1-phosphatidylinositol-3-phosphate 5-kinase [Arachis hypogaea]|nr:1-phosphatidylinositol-3-phosphate 5-kinase [Arachis hypogaea]